MFELRLLKRHTQSHASASPRERSLQLKYCGEDQRAIHVKHGSPNWYVAGHGPQATNLQKQTNRQPPLVQVPRQYSATRVQN